MKLAFIFSQHTYFTAEVFIVDLQFVFFCSTDKSKIAAKASELTKVAFVHSGFSQPDVKLFTDICSRF